MPPINDAALLLRVHAEHEWLQDELGSLLAQLEDPAAMGREQMQAALAYLEVTWAEALQRAARTDAACRRWGRARPGSADTKLGMKAYSYYHWLLALRASLVTRTEPFLGCVTGPPAHASPPTP